VVELASKNFNLIYMTDTDALTIQENTTRFKGIDDFSYYQ
jgi:hypothetical protein